MRPKLAWEWGYGRAGGKMACLKGMRQFRVTNGKLPHVIVFPAFDRLGHGRPLFVVLSMLPMLPRFASARARFAVQHRSRLYVTQSPSS
jgi:hypothetical protein